MNQYEDDDQRSDEDQNICKPSNIKSEPRLSENSDSH